MGEKRLQSGLKNFGLRFYEQNRTLPTPPSTKKYLQKQRQRIMNEKRRKLAVDKKADATLDSFVGNSAKRDDNSDPIQEQIRYVSEMLALAEEQGRTEEVKLLKNNL